MATILYKNIVLNDYLFVELFKNSYYTTQENILTENYIWGLLEKCVHIFGQKKNWSKLNYLIYLE